MVERSDDDTIASIRQISYGKHGDLQYLHQIRMPDGTLDESENLHLEKNGVIAHIYFRPGENFEDVEYGSAHEGMEKPGRQVLVYCKNDEHYNFLEPYEAVFDQQGKLEQLYKANHVDGKIVKTEEYSPEITQRVKDLRIEAIHKAAAIQQEQRTIWNNTVELLKTLGVKLDPVSYQELPSTKKAKAALAV